MRLIELVAIILFGFSLVCCSISLRLCSRLDHDVSIGDNEKMTVRLSKNAGIYWLSGLFLLSLAAVLVS